MASIFTFDPDPPRVSSPWTAARSLPGQLSQYRLVQESTESPDIAAENSIAFDGSRLPILDHTPMIRIEAEPQEGPVEYKLHLLLRKRRSFIQSSTRRNLSGSLRRTEVSTAISVGRSASESNFLASTPPSLSATQSRNYRLEQLTSQMLWRLQQSSSHNTSYSSERVNLQFPDGAQLSGPITTERLYPGLEDSKGALYEIGVADDGELVGLAYDEMEESLNNLRAMAASVGCRVEVQRVIAVGECEWVEHTGPLQHRTKKSRLLVAEAFIRPDQHFDQHRVSLKSEKMVDSSREASLSIVTGDETKKNVQLRISLTGATTSGKSSLLGTLSTGTLDDGRGKSRLNLLRHRHEIESGGITSSITQELIGYHDIVDIEGKTSTQVINYGSTDHSSWTAIHTSVSSSTSGRLLFLTDSAGHPRFLRTTVRGLVGWDPHYTLLCIPANNAQGSSEKIGTSPSAKGVQGAAGDLDLSMEHLHLCLALELPLLVVITKFDLATKAGLTSVILKIRTALHDAGRKTCIIANRSTSTSETGLDTIPLADLEEANQAVEPLKVSSASVVPIILTSALSGVGLSKLHAFLRKLPVPSPPTPPSNTPSTVFYLEDMYTKGPTQSKRSNEPTIVGGHLRYGTLSIGEELLLGPYPAETSPEDSDSGSGKISRQHPAIPVSRSFPGALNQKSTNSTQSSARSTSASLTEWRRVHIVSLRNLRQPVRTLHAGQVGTIGMSPVRGQASILSPAINRIRKGMILTNDKPSASRTLFVRFIGSSAQAANTLSIGSAVVIYAASVRASSKVMSISQEGGNGAKEQTTTDAEKEQEEEEEEGFGFGLDLDEDAASEFSDGDISGVAATVVTFQFIASREFVEANAKVLVMPGGGPGLTGTMERGEKGMAGLESFVGRVVDGRS